MSCSIFTRLLIFNFCILIFAVCLGAKAGKVRTIVQVENLEATFHTAWKSCNVSAKFITESELLGLIDVEGGNADERVYLIGVFDFPAHSSHRKRTDFHFQVELDGVALHPFVVSIPPRSEAHRVPFITEAKFFLPPNIEAKRKGVSALMPGDRLTLYVSTTKND